VPAATLASAEAAFSGPGSNRQPLPSPPGETTVGDVVRSLGVFVACRPFTKSCIVPGQRHDFGSQPLPFLFVVLRRARVEIVS
jgi:hypothetical protein